jgi:4-hydroxy-tetrahydrodipicolinate synthase
MTKLDESAKGVFVIAVTPFTDDGSLDLPSTDTMVDFYLAHGATGLTVLGMMGEAPKLTAEESQTFVRRVLARVDNRVPVVVGVSAPGLAPMRELAESVMNDGAAGVMVAPPAGLKTDESIASYFDMVAEMLGPKTPWVLQDYPLSTGVQIAVPVIQRVILNHANCVMLKHEDWPGLAKISAIRAAESKGQRRISILTGNGGLFLPEELHRGADGAMTGFAYPEMMVTVCKAYAAGDIDHAHNLFDAYLPLARYEQQPNIGLAVRKHTLAQRGAIASPTLRKPGPRLSAADLAEIAHLVERQTKRLRSFR